MYLPIMKLHEANNIKRFHYILSVILVPVLELGLGDQACLKHTEILLLLPPECWLGLKACTSISLLSTVIVWVIFLQDLFYRTISHGRTLSLSWSFI